MTLENSNDLATKARAKDGDVTGPGAQLEREGDARSTARPRADGPACGLVLAGAVAKGPFAAGALSVIAAREPDLNIVNVVGTSSGALNAAVFAAGLSANEPRQAAAELERLWRDRATWSSILTHAQRVGILKDALRPFARPSKGARKVRLRISVTSLRGEVRPLAPADRDPHKDYRDDGSRAPHTRFEETYSFTQDDLLDERQHEKIAEAAISSAALPVVFPTGFVGQQGPYVDGGLVNNAPISLAIRDHDAIDRVLVVTPEPAVVPPRRHLGRFSLGTLLEIVIQERLARDIDEARRFNDKLAKLSGVVDAETIKANTGWRRLEIVEIRPDAVTPGGAVSGFFSKSQRVANIELGQRWAERALDSRYIASPT
jgi:NTE family protein